MKKESTFKILSNRLIAADVYEMVLSGDATGFTRPGQFVNIRLDGFFLRRPISVCDWTEDSLGYLIYFFEKACAISGYVLGVNPFNQPGVEAYKKNMFALLGKPGYEDMKAALEARLG